MRILMLCCILSLSANALKEHRHLQKSLRPYIRQIVTELHEVLPERRTVLDQIAEQIALRLTFGKTVELTFICTHNSRRSHMSQLWTQTAAYYYGLDKVHSFSGGTETTACNIRTVSALRRAGFTVKSAADGQNPVYLIQFSDERPPVRAYSKRYNADNNPHEDFIALMCCSKADKKCPVIQGASSRYAIHYVDPKICDDTTEESFAYDERCREIAREMFYIMSKVHERVMTG